MQSHSLLAKLALLPISKAYGMVTAIRNWMFDVHILKETTFPVPVIVVGNLAVGGTGKTPHVEYIVEHLRGIYNIGVLSRGYKRFTKGFVMASQFSKPTDIGDEPYQIYHKFNGEVPVAVCEKRVDGINELLKANSDINLLILDDAFQHRYVKPTVAIVLTEFNRPVYEDSMLPYGCLRESMSQLRRANIIVATKCPEKNSALDYRLFEENLKLMACQKLFFSKFTYGHLQPIFPEAAAKPPMLEWLTEEDRVLCVAGIGNPKPFVRYLKHFNAKVRVNIYRDHHNFTRKDMATIQQRYESMEGNRKLLITTEKDAVRLANCPYFPPQLKKYAYYLTINVEIMRNEADAFIEQIKKVIKQSL